MRDTDVTHNNRPTDPQVGMYKNKTYGRSSSLYGVQNGAYPAIKNRIFNYRKKSCNERSHEEALTSSRVEPTWSRVPTWWAPVFEPAVCELRALDTDTGTDVIESCRLGYRASRSSRAWDLDSSQSGWGGARR
jgi:hypothetical protein